MKPRKPRKPVPQGGEIILYQTEDGQTRIDCRFEEGTIWLTQAQIAELFQTTPQNVTLHLKAIFAEGELAEAATCKDYLQVRQEGTREVSRNLLHYRLEAILAVGFRVRSRRGTQPPHRHRTGRRSGCAETAHRNSENPSRRRIQAEEEGREGMKTEAHAETRRRGEG